VKLTPAQMAELKRLSITPQHTYGPARARVQHNLRRLNLVRFRMGDCDLCEITDEGRSVLAARPAPASGKE